MAGRAEVTLISKYRGHWTWTYYHVMPPPDTGSGGRVCSGNQMIQYLMFTQLKPGVLRLKMLDFDVI